MRFDSLSKPVSDDAPSGPDLDDEMDQDYLNYTMVAADRLPAGYLVVDPGTNERKPFDRSSIEIDKEVDVIAGLLERTRDIRLLTLDARFNAVAGKIVEFSEATQGLAIVVSSFWDTFHPGTGDMIVRQNTVESIDNLGQVVLHLQNAPIAGGGRSRAVSLRNYLVASGKAEARQDEEVVPTDQISLTMSGQNSKGDRVQETYDQVTAVTEAIKASVAALDQVRSVFLEKAGVEFSPTFTNLLDTYKQIQDMIGVYRRDLAPAGQAGSDGESTGEFGSDGGGTITLSGAVKTHAAATAALNAAAAYFLRVEPSSPALILVHQARMLIGKPLVSALEALLPEPSARAALRFEGGIRFDIDLARMRSVTDDALASPEATSSPNDWMEATGGESASSDSSSEWDSSASSEASSDWGASSSEEQPAEETSSTEDGGYSSESTESTESTDSGEYGSSETGEAPAEVPADESGTGEYAAAEEAPAEEPAEWPEPVAEEPPPPPPPPPDPANFVARTRSQAADLIQATESFYRSVEPSSAIPLLLNKARTYLSKDFATILMELIPREEEPS